MRTKDGIPVALIRVGIRVAKARRWVLRALGLARRRVVASSVPVLIVPPMPRYRPPPGSVAEAVRDAWDESAAPGASSPHANGRCGGRRGRPATWYADSYNR
jgi:hypothetical protein